jgi:hypothetical protein
LVDDLNREWRVWNQKEGHTFIIQIQNDQLTLFDETYDRLDNLTTKRLDRIYRFLKLSRKLNWSFADLDWALRSLQKTPLGEKVLHFDGVNDFISIPNVKEDINKLEEFTLEAWVQPAKAKTHPIFAKGSPDGALTQFMLWITPQGKLAFFSNLDKPLEFETKDHPQNDKNYPRNALKCWGNLVAYKRDDKAWFHEKDGNFVAIDIHNIPAADVDQKQHGIVLMSDGHIPLDAFTHVAITVNEESEILVVEDNNSDTPAVKRTYFQLKFYINGNLDST